MIGRIKGNLIAKKPSEVLIDVHGLGYEVLISMTTYYQLPEPEHSVCLHTQLLVREDAHTLVGFFDLNERELFRALIKVNGVGAKLALTVLSSLSPAEFMAAILQNDLARLHKIPGIGKKTAERLIVELRDKLAQGLDSSLGQAALNANGFGATASNSSDALSALLYLGYSSPEANRALALIEDIETLSSEVIIKNALKHLAR